MSTTPTGNNAGQGSMHAEDADSLDLNGRQASRGRERQQAVAGAQKAGLQRATAYNTAAIDPLVADQALATQQQPRDSTQRPPNEARSPSKSAEADVDVLRGVDRRHDGLQATAAGTLGIEPAQDAAVRDVAALARFTDKTLRSRATAVMGDAAEQHPSYRLALKAVSPHYAGLAERAYADEQQRSVAKGDRKSLEYAGRRDDAADSIAGRYATMANAGLTARDLQGQALDRLAVKDSRDLLLIEGFPPHARASEAKALVADSLKIDAYRATFDRETAEWATHGPTRQAGGAARSASNETRAQPDVAPASRVEARAESKPAPAADRVDINTMRLEGEATNKRRSIPPLEDRFNVKRTGLVEKEYHFRDQAGKVAFTDKLTSISTASESPAAIKAMVDRAAERGWQTLRLEGSAEFVRQGWIAAAAQGMRAVGHTPTPGDREAAAKEKARLHMSQDTPATQRSEQGIAATPAAGMERARSDRSGPELSGQLNGQRHLAAAIEKALADGKVSPELRGQVRTMMVAEGARRIAKGDKVKVPVYDSRAPRTRSKTVQVAPHRQGERERSR